MNMLDIFEFLRIMTLETCESGGLGQSNNETIQTFLKWPLIYYLSLLCQHHRSGSFLLQNSLFLTAGADLILIPFRLLSV
jgi:hypothetical protein